MNTSLNTRIRRRCATTMLIVAGGMGWAMGGSAANAATDGDLRTAVVRYDQRDLESDRGVQSLYRRLVSASEEVCPQHSNTKLAGRTVQQCRERAMAGAVAKINDRRLTAMYDARPARAS